MSPEAAGITGIFLLLILFMLRVHVAFAMAIVGFMGIAYLYGIEPAFNFLAQDFYDTFSSYPLTVIPMFVLMGSFDFSSGISKRLYETTYTWVGQLPGGLTISTVFACSSFAAICGSSVATAATMGKIAIPEMKKYGYNDSLASGSVAAAGTLGILIPPSTVLVIYGILVEESIGKLFLAGIVPGILLCLLFVAVVYFICRIKPHYGPPGNPTSWKLKIQKTSGIIEALILFLLVIGGLFLGWFSPTQAGAIGAAGALAIGVFRRRLTWQIFTESAKDGLLTSCMVMFIVFGAIVFGHFMTISNIPFFLSDWIGNLPIHRMWIMIVIIIIYFMGGFFVDSMALVVLTIPIFYPLIMRLGFDPIWFGIVVVLTCEMGVISPPVGVNVFVIKGIAPEIPLEKIFWGIMPFLAAMIVFTCIIIIFPQIVTFLPSYVK